MLLAMTALLTASVARKPQAPATGTAGPASQDRPKSTTTASANPSRRKIPCKTPENASLCYWTHGRLSFYEGWVNYQIWKIGTRRMLGVFSGPSHYPALTNQDLEPEFPLELNRAYEADNRRHKKATGMMWTIPPPVFADFEVCPLRPEQEGERQPVCIEAAKNIIVQNDDN
ncbi:MAG TPA: hypothetical protein VN943_04240 [Candidatus Acidoferrum sp.]|nr:hypothetical protein [Candidatus Acidoferrum sp.]